MSLDVPGVDLAVLRGWMDARGLGEGDLTGLELIAGGTQNVLLRFTRAGRTYVLRRPPVHKRANSDETMRREARVLAALAGTPVPHPGLIAAEPDPDVIGAAFYLMEPIDGFNATLGLPAAYHDPAWQHSMGLSMADAIAALASVDKYCDIWRRNVFKRIKRMKPGLVLVGSAANRQAYSVLRYGHKLSRQASERRLVAGMVRTFRFLKRWAGETVLIRDQSVAPFDVTTCLRKNWRHARRCGFRPTRTMTRSYDYKAARRFGVRVIDPQQLLCPNRFCRPLDGRFQIYRNDSHFAATFTRRQYRWLGRKIGNPWPEIKKRQKRRLEETGSGFPEPLGRTMWPGAAGNLGG